jgi:hypothetical protein
MHDLRCTRCQAIERGVLVEVGRYPKCDACGGVRTWVPAGFHTDLFGRPQYSDATGKYHTSQRDKVRHLKALGYEEAGDPVHGARPELRIKNTAFSYAGQAGHISTQERAQRRSASARR